MQRRGGRGNLEPLAKLDDRPFEVALGQQRISQVVMRCGGDHLLEAQLPSGRIEVVPGQRDGLAKFRHGGVELILLAESETARKKLLYVANHMLNTRWNQHLGQQSVGQRLVRFAGRPGGTGNLDRLGYVCGYAGPACFEPDCPAQGLSSS